MSNTVEGILKHDYFFFPFLPFSLPSFRKWIFLCNFFFYLSTFRITWQTYFFFADNKTTKKDQKKHMKIVIKVILPDARLNDNLL